MQRRQISLEHKHIPYLNNIDNVTPFVPRTQRQLGHVDKRPTTEEFVKELRAKLEILRRERNNHEIMQSMNPTNTTDGSSRQPPIPSKNQINHGQLVADLKRFQLEEDNDQLILDQHVSRVWADSPHRSPGTISPCPALPTRRRTHDLVTTGGDGKINSISLGFGLIYFCRFQLVNQCDIQNPCLIMRPLRNDLHINGLP